MAFEKEIKEYEDLRGKYQTLIINKMDKEEYIKPVGGISLAHI